MKFSIVTSLLAFSWQSATVLAAPLDSGAGINALDARAPTIPNADEVRAIIDDSDQASSFAKIGEPQIDKAIFFTGQARQQINQIVTWANSVGLTSVRNIWNSANFYQRGQYKDIDDATFKDFQKAFSKYYADQTKGTAWLVFPQDQTPAQTGIFWSVELDEIISEAKVDKIVWIDQNRITDSTYDWANEQKLYWQKGDDKPAGA
ncbi:hypothetical protein NPX13_g3492 [Xylaria arbuscula]|uniref:GH26 domain-containing protein n=1 Tax=Xylaria arbuscula TaxID=114810 RepID=A0A9W8TQ17_9PEZI|nr:hypothetical protein NPX13_g3492 [Xylaria arbuscula]